MPDYLDYVSRQKTFEALGAYRDEAPSVSGRERADRVSSAQVSRNTFEILAVKPQLGRNFVAGEDVPGAEPVVIIGHAMWQNRFGSDPQIVGKTMRVNGRASTIVGVMPEGFRFPNNQELWRPLAINATARRDAVPASMCSVVCALV
jgi:hypothetical protein